MRAGEKGADSEAVLSSKQAWFLQGEAHLEHLFQAFFQLETHDPKRREDVVITQFGDSHTAGDLATRVVRNKLQDRFGAGDRGLVSIGNPWGKKTSYFVQGVTGHMHPDVKVIWPHLRLLKTDKMGNIPDEDVVGLLGLAIELNRPEQFAETIIHLDELKGEKNDPKGMVLELWLDERPLGGEIEIYVNHHLEQTATTDLYESQPHMRSSQNKGSTQSQPLLRRVKYLEIDLSHLHQNKDISVELRATSRRPVRIFGGNIKRKEREAPGISYDSLGVIGERVSLIRRIDIKNWEEGLLRRHPELFVLAYGSNESSDAIPISEHRSSLAEAILRIKKVLPQASCLILGLPDRSFLTPDHNWVTPLRVMELNTMQAEMARQFKCAYYNQFEAMGGTGSMARWASLPMPTPTPSDDDLILGIKKTSDESSFSASEPGFSELRKVESSKPSASLFLRAGKDHLHFTRAGANVLGSYFFRDLMKAYDAWKNAMPHPPAPPSPLSSPSSSPSQPKTPVSSVTPFTPSLSTLKK